MGMSTSCALLYSCARHGVFFPWCRFWVPQCTQAAGARQTFAHTTEYVCFRTPPPTPARSAFLEVWALCAQTVRGRVDFRAVRTQPCSRHWHDSGGHHTWAGLYLGVVWAVTTSTASEHVQVRRLCRPFPQGPFFHLFRDRLQVACPLVPCVSQPLEPVRCACEYNGITRTPLCAHVHARLGVCQAFPSSMVLCTVHWPALPSLVHACARPGTQSQPISCASAPNHSVPAAGVGVLPCA